MNNKVQSAIEFVILVGVIFFFFISFLFAVQLNIYDKARDSRKLVIQEIALTMQDEINLAADSSDGYYRKFEIPEKVANLDYEINITAGTVYVRTINGKHALALPVTNVVGQPNITVNVIRKENGVVYLNTNPLVCGNGVIESGEQCDDGNLISGDGCNKLCKIESEWNCVNCGAGPSECALETLPQCNNEIDDDCDGLIDYPTDTGCLARSDDSEGTVAGLGV